MQKKCKTCGFLKDNFENTNLTKAYDEILRRYTCKKFDNPVANINQRCGCYIEKTNKGD